ncbi:hypothetical protein AMTR_s00136p00059680 [Amborella trichopoda]|uniref:Uncharacterized protein n=1 Tax=Amborella trichopoda TaxID=13333 RepID=W1NDZ5_AMBTC|nr:hypothetical protein AMTR_s00136p00059680 [Amborella trichopoda]
MLPMGWASEPRRIKHSMGGDDQGRRRLWFFLVAHQTVLIGSPATSRINRGPPIVAYQSGPDLVAQVKLRCKLGHGVVEADKQRSKQCGTNKTYHEFVAREREEKGVGSLEELNSSQGKVFNGLPMHRERNHHKLH